MQRVNSFLASGDFYCLVITLSMSLDPKRSWFKTFDSKLTPWKCSWKNKLEKLNFEEKIISMQRVKRMSANNLCKQLGPRSGPTQHQSWSGSKQFNTLTVFMKEFFEKCQQSSSKAWKLPSMERTMVYLLITFASSLDPDQDWQNVNLIWIQTVWHFDNVPGRIFMEK